MLRDENQTSVRCCHPEKQQLHDRKSIQIAPNSVNNSLILLKSCQILHVSADIDSHLFKNHLNAIRHRPEVERKIGVEKYLI